MTMTKEFLFRNKLHGVKPIRGSPIGASGFIYLHALPWLKVYMQLVSPRVPDSPVQGGWQVSAHSHEASTPGRVVGGNTTRHRAGEYLKQHLLQGPSDVGQGQGRSAR